jgi:hypothetical protein
VPWVQVAIPVYGAWQFGLSGPGPQASDVVPPTEAELGGELTERVRLVEIEVHFDAGLDPVLAVTQLDVWNGAQAITSFGSIRERGPTLNRSFSNVLLNARGGLNLSLRLDFPTRLDASQDPGTGDVRSGFEYTFNSDAAFYDLQGV